MYCCNTLTQGKNNSFIVQDTNRSPQKPNVWYQTKNHFWRIGSQYIFKLYGIRHQWHLHTFKTLDCTLRHIISTTKLNTMEEYFWNKTVLCNSTRMVVTRLRGKILETEILTHKWWKRNVIPRIIITTLYTNCPYKMRKSQYPIRACYAITINKNQGHW